jgi:chloride channel protein, CIC family
MRRQTHLLFDTIVLGIIGALGAELFRFLLDICQSVFLNFIAGYNSPGLMAEGKNLVQVIGSHGLWLVPLALVIGGLISGFLVYTFAPEAEGHGTDTAVKAFHRQGGSIRRRVAPIKILASAITIGSGGSAGREGPTALFSAGFGSIYADILKRSDKEKRLLVLIGMAAGLSAIFRSPIGTAIFAVEVLYSEMEFEADALLYTILGAVIAYAVNAVFVGWQPLFLIPANIKLEHLSDYAWYIILGLASGVIGTMLPNVFYITRDIFKKIPIPPHFKPALGALGVGIIALVYPQVLGGGYGWIQKTINGQLALSLLFVLLFGKMIAFSLTVSSGGSGGVFAPTLFVGAMLGGMFAHIFHQPPAAFVVVGMAAVFGSSARVPIATFLMVTEMTGGYGLLVPAALAVMLAHYVQGIMSSSLNVKYTSLYEAQVPRKSDSQAHRREHLQRALSILQERRSLSPETVEDLDLVSLLESKIPLDITDEEQLLIGFLNPKSKCVGTKIKDKCLNPVNKKWEVIAIIRDEQFHLPTQDTILEPEDELIMLAVKDSVEVIKKQLESDPEKEGSTLKKASEILSIRKKKKG